MPANLTPEYYEAEERYRSASGPRDRLAALEEMLRVIPKHKGTDKLQADLKSKIAKLKKQPKKKGGARTHTHHIPHEGAGQVALVGPPNSGKSTLVDRLTHASPEVAEYPFTTREPVPGMFPFEDIAFQLIDLPPLSREFVEPWVYDCIRGADIVWLVLDSEGMLEELELVQALLDKKHIGLERPGAADPEARQPTWTYKPALMVVTGADRPGARGNAAALDELLGFAWPKVIVSGIDGTGFDELGRRTFEVLDLVRVYTKQPGKPADRDQPFALGRGATVEDLARTIHKDIAQGFKFARIWGEEVFDGQTVQREHVLHDGDVVEIHA